MRKNSFLRKALKKWQSLCLVDRLLLTFMVILLLQSVHNLFFYGIMQEETKTIDVIIRTTAAAVFGYFISGSFQGTNESAKQVKNAIGFAPQANHASEKTTGRIGFSANAQTDDEIQMGHAKENPETLHQKRIHQQVIIVSFIGLSSLVILIVARNYTLLPASAVSTVSQLRDFVSGSVGFLIGHSGSERR